MKLDQFAKIVISKIHGYVQPVISSLSSQDQWLSDRINKIEKIHGITPPPNPAVNLGPSADARNDSEDAFAASLHDELRDLEEAG